MQLHRMYPRHYSTTGVCVCQSVLAVLAAVEAIVVMKVMASPNAVPMAQLEGRRRVAASHQLLAVDKMVAECAAMIRKNAVAACAAMGYAQKMEAHVAHKNNCVVTNAAEWVLEIAVKGKAHPAKNRLLTLAATMVHLVKSQLRAAQIHKQVNPHAAHL